MKNFLKKWVIGKISWCRFLRSLLLIYGFFFAVGMISPETLIFQPHASSYESLPGGFTFSTEDSVSLYGIFIENPNVQHTVLFFHGNAEDLGDLLPYLQEYADSGFNVFSVDYRSYGKSTGTPNEKNCYEDLKAIAHYLFEEKKISPNRLLVHGRSLGGGLATEFASRFHCGGLILESSFVSAFRVLTRIPIFPFDQFKNLEKLPQIQSPILVMHGKKDSVISFWHGKALFSHAPGLKDSLWVEDAGHNDLFLKAGEAYWQKIKTFSQIKTPTESG